MAKKKNITSIITGDLIKSRRVKPNQWLPPLKKILSYAGKSPEAWEVYRGDSFQVEIKDPAIALLTAIRIKATIKSIAGLDVRMAIGIGAKEFPAAKITEANGEAYVNSGQKLEALKKEKQSLALKTPWNDFDTEMNICLRLALIAMDSWTSNAAQLMQVLLDHPEITQMKLAKKLKITQSAVSRRQKRAYYTEIMELESLYRKKIKPLLL
jgi:hypothetical protein